MAQEDFEQSWKECLHKASQLLQQAEQLGPTSTSKRNIRLAKTWQTQAERIFQMLLLEAAREDAEMQRIYMKYVRSSDDTQSGHLGHSPESTPDASQNS